MPVNLNALRLFEAVARAGTFTRGAVLAHVSQPAISKAVRSLERALGVELFERGAHGVQLTAAGALLAEHARSIVASVRKAEEELGAVRGLTGGSLTIGASTTIGTYLLPPLVGAYTRRYPGIEVRLINANTEDIVRRLLGYELDIALVEGPVADSRIMVEPWREDRLVLIAPAGHPLAGRTVPWTDLTGETLLVREPGSGTAAVVATALVRSGFTPSRTLELGGTEVIKSAVAAGLGLAFVSQATVADQLALGTLALVEVEQLDIRRTFAHLALPHRRPSAAARALRVILDLPVAGDSDSP